MLVNHREFQVNSTGTFSIVRLPRKSCHSEEAERVRGWSHPRTATSVTQFFSILQLFSIIWNTVVMKLSPILFCLGLHGLRSRESSAKATSCSLSWLVRLSFSALIVKERCVSSTRFNLPFLSFFFSSLLSLPQFEHCHKVSWIMTAKVRKPRS